MSAGRTGELIAAIRRQVSVLESIFASIEQAMHHDVEALGRSGNSAVMVAGLLDNYYTYLETAFLRISQFFENSLSEKRRHTDLLELLKFRHFRRYYFELQYDWGMLDLLIAKLRKLHPRILADLERFSGFVRGI